MMWDAMALQLLMEAISKPSARKTQACDDYLIAFKDRA